MSMRCNNNPNALQLQFILRGLLCHAGVKPSNSANVEQLDETELLCPTVAKYKPIDNPIYVEDHPYSKYYAVELSEFVTGIVEYIRGFVARKLLQKLKCHECRTAVVQPATTTQPEFVISLIQLKNNGGLLTPSPGLLRICNTTEKSFRL